MGTRPFRPSNSRPRNSVNSGSPQVFTLYQATVNVSYAPDVFGGQRRQIEANAAQAEYQRFELEAAYLTLTSNVVTAAVQEASLRGQIVATQEIIKAANRPACRRAPSIRGRRGQSRRRADAGIRGGDDGSDVAAAAEATGTAAPRAAGFNRPLSE